MWVDDVSQGRFEPICDHSGNDLIGNVAEAYGLVVLDRIRSFGFGDECDNCWIP